MSKGKSSCDGVSSFYGIEKEGDRELNIDQINHDMM